MQREMPGWICWSMIFYRWVPFACAARCSPLDARSMHRSAMRKIGIFCFVSCVTIRLSLFPKRHC